MSETKWVVRPDGLEVKISFDAGCPKCGDSLQTVFVTCPDHGMKRRVALAWCMDCLSVRGWAVELDALERRDVADS